MRPVVSAVAEQETAVDFFYVDVDQAPDLASKFGIMSIPTLVQIKNGKETNRSVGFIPEEQVKEFAVS
ncbi:thioredoxin family protein [Bacillus sp. V3-13]|uniref:thioredoxin family protein n=1 Tax=Bacillus sp. V3-13 TaxID=2053728 RepID=UPI0021532FCA|nr:thioredoxin family protein [Bacillus sp. V3-13]